MVPLTSLWLPILLSAVFVFIASFILHMALGFWHRSDYRKAPNETALLDALTPMSSGQYVVPLHDYGKLTPEERKAAMARPSAMILLRNPHNFSFPKTLGTWFLYCLVISFVVGYLASETIAAGASYLHVHRIAGTAAILAWALGHASDSIWYGRPWSVTLKQTIDGVIYGLVTGGTFGWLWPN